MPSPKNIQVEVDTGLLFGVFVHYPNKQNLSKKITKIEPIHLSLI